MTRITVAFSLQEARAVARACEWTEMTSPEPPPSILTAAQRIAIAIISDPGYFASDQELTA